LLLDLASTCRAANPSQRQEGDGSEHIPKGKSDFTHRRRNLRAKIEGEPLILGGPDPISPENNN
jgi:hypothetical protein